MADDAAVVDQSNKTTLVLDLDFTPYLSNHVPDRDGDYSVQPVTFEDLVLDAAAFKLMSAAINKRDGSWDTLRKRVDDITKEQIAEAIQPLIREAIENPFRKTNTFGEPVGEPVTLREVIVEQARKTMSEPVDRNRREKGSWLDDHIRTTVQAVVKDELAPVIAEAKAEVLTKIGAAASDMIVAAVKEAIGVTR